MPVSTKGLVTVTGAGGLLGGAVTKSLIAAGWSVRPVDIGVPSKLQNDVDATMPCDLRRYEDAQRAVAGADAVVHCAGLHAIHLESWASEPFFENNVRSTFNLLDACARQGVGTFVFTSSTAVYGTAGDPTTEAAVWVDERTPRDWRTTNVYHATKVLGEDLCHHHASATGARVIALRCTRFCTGDTSGDEVRLLSQGVGLVDAAEAHRLAVEKADAGFAAVNIGPPLRFAASDRVELFREPTRVIERAFPGSIERCAQAGIELPERISRVYDITMARHVLGYSPTVGFGDVLTKGWPA